MKIYDKNPQEFKEALSKIIEDVSLDGVLDGRFEMSNQDETPKMNIMQKYINEMLDKAKKFANNKENVVGALVLVVRSDDTFLTNYYEAEVSNEDEFKFLRHAEHCLQKLQKDFKEVLEGKPREIGAEWN